MGYIGAGIGEAVSYVIDAVAGAAGYSGASAAAGSALGLTTETGVATTLGTAVSEAAAGAAIGATTAAATGGDPSRGAEFGGIGGLFAGTLSGYLGGASGTSAGAGGGGGGAGGVAGSPAVASAPVDLSATGSNLSNVTSLSQDASLASTPAAAAATGGVSTPTTVNIGSQVSQALNPGSTAYSGLSGGSIAGGSPGVGAGAGSGATGAGGGAAGAGGAGGGGAASTPSFGQIATDFTKGNYVSGLEDAGSKIAANSGPLVAAAGLGLNMMGQQNIKGSNALSSQAQQFAQQGSVLQSYLNTGTLPPAVQASVNQATRSGISAIQNKYASMGVAPGSAQEVQDIARLQQQAVISGATLADQLLQQGISESNMSADIYKSLVSNNTNLNAQTTSAVGNLATALAGGVRLGANSNTGSSGVTLNTAG